MALIFFKENLIISLDSGKYAVCFGLLEMAWHQPQMGIVSLIQLPRVVNIMGEDAIGNDRN